MDEHARLAQEKPGLFRFETPKINVETPAHLLDDEITPVERLFARNTGRLPDIDAEALARWTLRIDGAVYRPQAWTVASWQRDFETVTQAAVIECAGNGRAFFQEDAGVPRRTHGAAGCAEWTASARPHRDPRMRARRTRPHAATRQRALESTRLLQQYGPQDHRNGNLSRPMRFSRPAARR